MAQIMGYNVNQKGEHNKILENYYWHGFILVYAATHCACV